MADEFKINTQAFVAWFSALPGVTINRKIELADYRDRGAGRGVRALQDIDADEDLFSVSRADVISVENSELAKKLPELFSDDLDPWLSLVLVLIYEYQLGEQSRWKAYFDVLPKTFETLMFWSDDELKELQASAVVRKIGKDKADATFRDEIVPKIKAHPELFNSASLTDEALLKMSHAMSSIIMAYAFDLEKNEEHDADEDGYGTDEDDELLPKGMVPMADMLNADADSNASLFYGVDTLTMRSLRHIPAGSEVLNDYGQLPRSDLLRRYGYITPKYSRFDCVELSRGFLDPVIFKHFPMPDDFESRIEYLEERELLDNSYDIIWPENSENMDFFPDDLSRYVKTMLADDEKWMQVARTGISNPTLMKMFETVMRDAVSQKMAQYSTSLQEDMDGLKDPAITGRRRIAVQVRAGEKLILHRVSERLQSQVPDDEEPAGKRRKLI